jgi:hypothetical protein
MYKVRMKYVRHLRLHKEFCIEFIKTYFPMVQISSPIYITLS